jgi:hypothetical protein
LTGGLPADESNEFGLQQQDFDKDAVENFNGRV